MTRFKSVERPPAGRPVCIELHGKRHEGTYTVDGPMVTVQTLTLGDKTAPLGDSPPIALARLLLAELVYDDERRTPAARDELNA